ncbi:hypothetical protein KQI38_13925 [Tissierella carlieri]|uniref:hypothetical protein n=1 Tax=Tissierella carlieri TaxID=689904 RepID=UPI001C0FCDC7|nr:hypothetical protein [Tissierella carlieri]MBU5313138.1 hypothetical protein [Tissierella carlieri]
MNKKLRLMLSLILALTMVMGSVASAANMLYYNVTLEKEYTTPMTNESVDELIAEYNNGNEIAKLVNNKLVNYDEYRAAVIEVLQEALDSGKTEEEAIEAVVAAIPSIVEGLEEVELPEEELKVVEVSAIDKTIDLNVAVFEAEEGATAKVAIFALDEEGAKTGTAMVTANAVEIKDNVVTFDISSKNFGDDEYVVEVTIGEETQVVNVALEFKAVEDLVAKINTATAAQLATLLADDTYFTGFDVANVDAYKANVTGTFKTVAEVQELVIDAANEAAEAGSYFVEFKAALDDATGEFAKYTVLKQYFQFVDDANMDAYMDVAGLIFTTDLALDGGMTTVELVQDKIDQINLDAVVTNDSVIIDADAKPSELNAYKAALVTLELVNEETEDTVNSNTKAETIEAIDTQLEAIAEAREAADAAIVEAEEALAAFEVAFGEDFAEETEYIDVVGAVEALVAEDLSVNALATTTLVSAVEALKAATKALTVIDDANVAMGAYLAAGGEETDPEYVALVGALEGFTADPATKSVEDVTNAIEDLEAETTKLVIYGKVMKAETATEMRALLFEFENSDYLNLSSAKKNEFAEWFIDELAAEDPVPADYDEIKALLGTKITAYETLINGVNTADNIADMITALTALGNEAFDALTTAQKSDVADAVLANVPYATLADIVAAMGL